ncbi:hypothetical protein ILYODFUR_013164 [Ilyodon furcidens]|uniref:Uncharacterized protein n=1 Tax=Ilyodon furcidens TaxID=33524 RepID=A0ABV0SMI4_9TELE
MLFVFWGENLGSLRWEQCRGWGVARYNWCHQSLSGDETIPAVPHGDDVTGRTLPKLQHDGSSAEGCHQSHLWCYHGTQKETGYFL